MKNYCPECGDDRYHHSSECISCGFPHLSEQKDFVDFSLEESDDYFANNWMSYDYADDDRLEEEFHPQFIIEEDEEDLWDWDGRDFWNDLLSDYSLEF